jgi:CDP-diacylglycerol---serine O-phosphatidyltransferase
MPLFRPKPPFALNAAIALHKEDIKLWFRPNEYKQQLLSLIAGARQRIYLCALYLQTDEAGLEILSALYQAQQCNPALEIKLFVDYHRALRGLIGQKQGASNRDGYLQCASDYPLQIDIYGVPVKRQELFGVLHLKGMVIDDTLLYSGASLNNVYLQQHDKYRLDRYYQIANAELAHSFCHYLAQLQQNANLPLLNQAELPNATELKQIIKKVRTYVRTQHYHVPERMEGATTLSVKPLVGCGLRDNQLNTTIRHLLRESAQSIVLFTPYFNLPKVLVRELHNALARGVQVGIVVGDKTANDFYLANTEPFTTIGVIPYIYEQVLRRFVQRFQAAIEAGQLNIHLWQDGANSFHVKGLVIDERYHLLTGNNLNPRAWRLDLENGLLIDDVKQQLQSTWQQELTGILAYTKRIATVNDLDTIADYPTAPRKLLTKLRLSQMTRLLQRLL